MPNRSNLHLNMLLQSLHLLAASYEQQMQAFPSFVHVPDEVALVFSDAYLFVPELTQACLITTDQSADLAQVEQVLDHMSQRKEVWTVDALKTSPQWKEVRQLAHKLLDSFHEPNRPPDLFWLQYVPDHRTSS